MNSKTKPEDKLLSKLRDDSYDLTEGIPSSEHDHESVRRFEHAGREVEIHTSYRIIIDGQEFPDPIHVANDGSVHYHGFPQYSTRSAVELVKMIVERLAEGEPPPPIGKTGNPPDGLGTHDHGQ